MRSLGGLRPPPSRSEQSTVVDASLTESAKVVFQGNLMRRPKPHVSISLPTRAGAAALAANCGPADLHRRGFRLYEQFRPSVPVGETGWGAKGELDLAKVRALVPIT